jgi:hypothetical protein
VAKQAPVQSSHTTRYRRAGGCGTRNLLKGVAESVRENVLKAPTDIVMSNESEFHKGGMRVTRLVDLFQVTSVLAPLDMGRGVPIWYRFLRARNPITSLQCGD